MATVGGTSAAGRRLGWPLSLAVLAASPVLAQEDTTTFLAQDWDIEPVLTVRTVLTDNVSRSKDGQESLVLEVSPGISLRRRGGRMRVGLDYRLQNFYYSHNGDFDASQQLLGTASTELVRDRVFLDIDASIGQSSTSVDGQLLDDNLVQDDDRSTFYSLSVNPYWQNDFAGYAESLVSYELGYVNYDDDQTSDAVDHDLAVQVTSGRRFTALRWSLGASVSRLERADAQDSEEQSLAAAASYPLTDDLRAIVETGYEETDLNSREFGEDGGYWRGGLSWVPSRFLQLTGLVGNDNSRFTLGFYPTVRTALEVTRLDQNVGRNAGVSWDGRLSHRTRYSTWSLSYSEEITSFQSLALLELFLDDEGRIVDGNGRPVDLRELLTGGGAFLSPNGLFLLTDEEFKRQRAALDVSYVRRRNRFNVGLYSETRDYQGNIDSEQVLGGSAGWTLQLAPRTTTSVIGQWQQEDGNAGQDNNQDQAWSVETLLTHDFPSDMVGSLSYLHVQGGGTEDFSGEDFQENRINLLLQVTF